METITLIANSGIQFHKFESKIESDFSKNNKINFIENYDTHRRKIWFSEVCYLSDHDVWIRKDDLKKHNLIDSKVSRIMK